MHVAGEYLGVKSDEATSTAKSILLSISEVTPNDTNVFPYSDALYYLGLIFEIEEKFSESSKFLTKSFLECTAFNMKSKSEVAFELLMCAKGRQLYSQSSFWLRKIELLAIPIKDRRVVAEKYVKHRAFLRKLRDTCGACGAKFEGKDRKFCGGCRAFCYCSRECQKMHWNCKVNGHREDCLGLKDLKVKLKEAKPKSDEHGN